MKHSRTLFVLSSLLGLACGSNTSGGEDLGPGTLGSGGALGSGGDAAATGGALATTGGASSGDGGAPGAGGATGGAPATGGSGTGGVPEGDGTKKGKRRRLTAKDAKVRQGNTGERPTLYSPISLRLRAFA